ncbi:DUF3616 domain-containing protein [Thiomicrorhabdus indica]|uniref:DUF3616 domain-containing protein n=1 Tax=Thiomicrorhabdus indica TaxID=2267253 RepID=UPI00102DE998|nr:DUF3616 domain-containing protein [Thiomicrorhabdus indica]
MNRLTFSSFLSVLCALFFSLNSFAASFDIEGKLSIDNRNISGLVITDSFAAMATDEGTAIQILSNNNGKFVADSSGVINLTSDNLELDLEGLAWEEPYLYAIGSHSKKRKKIKDDASEKKNLKRLAPIISEPSRHKLFQIELSPAGKVLNIQSKSLDEFISENEILAPFVVLPSKENGIDIEGIAVKDKQLWIGFRGPVLRGNYATILELELKPKKFKLKKLELKLVNLGGLGIRDMVATPNGLKVLAGPVNEIPSLYQVFDWFGQNQFNELKADRTLRNFKGKPECLTIDPVGRLWLGEDGPKNGAIRLLD